MSKVVLCMAISSDGFIAGPNGETPWSDAEWQSFQAFVLSCDLVLVGKLTYQIMQKQDELIAGVKYVVVTHDKTFNANDKQTVSIKSRKDIPEGNKIGVIGGAELNSSLAKIGAINELILDIDPIKLGSGVRLFGHDDIPLKLRLINSSLIGENTIQRHYEVLG